MKIIKTIRNQSGGIDIQPEKLYTQNEVDDLLEKSEDNHYQARELKKKRHELQTSKKG